MYVIIQGKYSVLHGIRGFHILNLSPYFFMQYFFSSSQIYFYLLFLLLQTTMAAAAPAPLDRAFGITNIKTHVPFLLDADEGNYDAWRELFLTHCQSFDVSGYLDGTVLPANDADETWKKRDGLVKLWIYGTLSKDLFKSVFKTGGTSPEIWLRLENFFRDNKESRAIQLDHKLRTQEI